MADHAIADDHEAFATTGVHAFKLPAGVFRVGQAMVKCRYTNVFPTVHRGLVAGSARLLG